MTQRARFKRWGLDVLAENVTVETTGKYGSALYVEFDFLCPNCGRRHWAREVSLRRFNRVGWALSCGRVMVRMPWAETQARDERSVYGGTKR